MAGNRRISIAGQTLRTVFYNLALQTLVCTVHKWTGMFEVFSADCQPPRGAQWSSLSSNWGGSRRGEGGGVHLRRKLPTMHIRDVVKMWTNESFSASKLGVEKKR